MKRITSFIFYFSPLLIFLLILLVLLQIFFKDQFRFKTVFDKPARIKDDNLEASKDTANVNQVKTSSGRTYTYNYFLVKDQEKLKLTINKQQVESKELIAKHSCIKAVNGGYYNTDKRPLGLVVIDNEEQSAQHDSSLLDGFFWQSKQNTYAITRNLPEVDFDFAAQSGPILIENGQTLLLSISNDKQARRVVVLNTADSGLIFLTIYDPQSLFLGPKLVDLPQALYKISQQEKWLITEALNLDGGSASMFKSETEYLMEFKTIGTLICVEESLN